MFIARQYGSSRRINAINDLIVLWQYLKLNYWGVATIHNNIITTRLRLTHVLKYDSCILGRWVKRNNIWRFLPDNIFSWAIYDDELFDKHTSHNNNIIYKPYNAHGSHSLKFYYTANAHYTRTTHRQILTRWRYSIILEFFRFSPSPSGPPRIVTSSS